MAWNVAQAAWVAGLSDPEIAQQVGTRTFERGRAYARQRKVRSVAARPDGMMILGTVEGSAGSLYQAIVEARPHPRGRAPLWSGRCDCPVGSDCKHVVALLLAVRDPEPDGVDDGPAAAEAPGAASTTAPLAGPRHWAEVLGHAAAPRRARPEPQQAQQPQPRGDLMPAGLLVDVVYRSTSLLRQVPEPSYGLRPTRWTRTGTWHGSLSWHDALPRWRGGSRFLPEHEQALQRLHELLRQGSVGTTSFTQAQPLSLEASPQVWTALREARDAGVAILPGEGVTGPVTLADEPARLALRVARATEGSGDLLLRVEVDDLPVGLSGELLHLGDPVHAVAVEGDDGSLTFVPLEQDLGLDRAGLLEAVEGLRVPAEERARFLAGSVPGLRERVRVLSDVPLPAPDDAGWRTPVVTVHARVRGDVPGEVRVDLGHAYDGVVRAFTTARFAGVGIGGRDRDAETAAVDAAESLALLPAAVRTDTLGHRHLAPVLHLRGLEAARFATDVLPALEADEHVTVEIDGARPVYEEVTEAPLVRVGTGEAQPGERGRREESGADWFDLRVTVEVGGEEVPFEPLFAALARGDAAMFLESGTWFRLDRPELHRLRELIDEAREIADPASGALRLSAHHADLWEELVALGVVDAQSARWAAAVEALAAAPSAPPAEVPAGLQATLRPYQLDGFRWLARLWDARIGGILADDMGLGKTLQTIAALLRAHERGELGGEAGPVLVVAPTSVVGTWLGELAHFAPQLPVVAVAETERRRGVPLAEAVAGAAVVVTSYAVLRLDDAAFEALPWAGVVLDEAQFVKNRNAKTHLAARRLGAPFTVALTGTPLENSLMDLWSLLSLTAPGLYPRPDHFTKAYRKPIESGERPDLLDLLRRRVRPLMLRRTKEQVAADLPPKQVQVVPVPQHPTHRHVYEQHLARERQRVLGLLTDPDANRVAILAALTRMRQLALDPGLVDPAHAGKATPAKVEFLVEQLRELGAEGHRALVFSQFTGFLRVVEAALDKAGLHTTYLDGSTKDRQAVVREFREGDAVAFLISLKAGGFGLTLTEADYVFVLDPWWNPAAEAQAIDRAHRIGQERPVTVYRLVSAGTVEEKVVALQERKRELFERVVDDGGALGGAVTADDVRALLTDG